MPMMGVLYERQKKIKRGKQNHYLLNMIPLSNTHHGVCAILFRPSKKNELPKIYIVEFKFLSHMYVDQPQSSFKILQGSI
jgi:hypothetical protein